MGLIVHRAQPGDGDVGVELGRRQRRVAQQLLHHAQVSATLEQVRCEGVAQSVHRHALVDAGRRGGQVDGAAYDVEGASADARSATVTVSSAWRPPVVSLLMPEGIRLDVTASARAVFVD